MHVTILLQIATNSIVEFVKMMLKIPAPHWEDESKDFFHDVKVKLPKKNCNNKKLAAEFWCYVVKDIWNLDQVLDDLKKD